MGCLNARDNTAELGNWIGNPSYWGRAYCIEAAREMVRYGFEILGLHRIHSSHFGSNSASGRVMQKIGIIREGTGREHYKKWGEYEDWVEYGLPTGEWRAAVRQIRDREPCHVSLRPELGPVVVDRALEKIGWLLHGAVVSGQETT